MRKRRIYLWAGCLCFLCMLTTCRQPEDFSAREKELIRKYAHQLMPLYTVDKEADSLFLRQTARAFSEREIRSGLYDTLKQNLFLTVQDTNNPGVGIAAPQVGISRQLIVVQRFDKPGEPFEAYINPVILFYSEEKKSGMEGCLSVPDKRGSVERSSEIIIAYTEENTFRRRQDTVRGFTAVIFQHETDHLKGILYTDRIENAD